MFHKNTYEDDTDLEIHLNSSETLQSLDNLFENNAKDEAKISLNSHENIDESDSVFDEKNEIAAKESNLMRNDEKDRNEGISQSKKFHENTKNHDHFFDSDESDDGINVITNVTLQECLIKSSSKLSKNNTKCNIRHTIDPALKPLEITTTTSLNEKHLNSPIKMAMLTTTKKRTVRSLQNESIREMQDELCKLQMIVKEQNRIFVNPKRTSVLDSDTSKKNARNQDRVFSCKSCLWEIKHKCFDTFQTVSLTVSDNKHIYSCRNCSFSVVHGIHIGKTFDEEIHIRSSPVNDVKPVHSTGKLYIMSQKFQCCSMEYVHKCRNMRQTCNLTTSFADDIQQDNYRISAKDFKGKSIKCEYCSTYVFHDNTECNTYKADKIVCTPIKTILSPKASHYKHSSNNFETFENSHEEIAHNLDHQDKKEGECSGDEISTTKSKGHIIRTDSMNAGAMNSTSMMYNKMKNSRCQHVTGLPVLSRHCQTPFPNQPPLYLHPFLRPSLPSIPSPPSHRQNQIRALQSPTFNQSQQLHENNSLYQRNHPHLYQRRTLPRYNLPINSQLKYPQPKRPQAANQIHKHDNQQKDAINANQLIAMLNDLVPKIVKKHTSLKGRRHSRR